MPTAVWTQVERRAWAPPEKLKPSEWAARYRYLARGQSPRPGPWRNEAAPYLRGIMDIPLRPGVVEVDIVKGAQGGVSEAMRNVMGYVAHMEPEPCGLALPSRDKGRKIVVNRILPMIESCEPLRELQTHRAADMQAEQIRLQNGFILHLMWSGSATSMASDPMRVAVCDEVDKFEIWVGREADPVSLVRKRLRAYGDRATIINISTPTTRFGRIWELYEAADVRLVYWIPCPECGAFQHMVFQQLKWDAPADLEKEELPGYILQKQTAYYLCEHCAARILPGHRQTITEGGQWRRLDGKPITDARGVEHVHAETVDVWPRGTRIGMHLTALAYLWTSWSEIVAEYLRSAGSLSRAFDFRTGTLGEPFEHMITRTTMGLYAKKSVAPQAQRAEGLVPIWATNLLATVDTQHDHFWVVIRAWGPGMRSARVWHGRLESFDDLDAWLFRHPFANEGTGLPAMVPELILIDSGGTRLEGERESRTMAVYRWAIQRRGRVRPIKGQAAPKGGQYIWTSPGLIRQSHRRNLKAAYRRELPLWFVAVHHFGDELADLVVSGVDGETPEMWELNLRNDEEYNRHLSNAIKIPKQDGLKVTEVWIPISTGARVDLWDAEVYQVAAAYMAGVQFLPPDEQIAAMRAAHRSRVADVEAERRTGADPWAIKRFEG